MRFLFDHNLSPRLVRSLTDVFPDSRHVRDDGLHTADDAVVWDSAAENGFVIVSKDSDFQSRSFLLGHPPKIIWIRLGNCSTREIEILLRKHQHEIEIFCQDDTLSFLALS